MASMDTAQFLGEHGGQLALAFGSGCVAGYGFCMRTIYKLLHDRTEADHNACMDRIKQLEEREKEMKERMRVVEDRLYMGSERQLAQVRESAVRVIEGTRKDDKDGI